MNKPRIIFSVLFLFLFITSILTGVSREVTLSALLNGSEEAWKVVFTSRLPRTITIILTASSLSIAGLVMQAINRNNFVSPQMIGSTNASILAILLIYLFIPIKDFYIYFIFVFTFTLITTFIFTYMVNKIKYKDIIYVPLIGMMFSLIIGSITGLIANLYSAESILSIIGLGSFTNTLVNGYEVIYLVLIPLILVYIFVAKFNIVALGEDIATNLGVNYKRVVIIGLILVSIISTTNFIAVGPLPFLGLIVPNLVRLFYGDNLKRNFIDVSLVGAVLVLISDIIARTTLPLMGIGDFEIPVVFVMGAVGAVIFLYLIFRKVKENA